MEKQDISDVTFEKLDRGYAGQWELMGDFFALIDYRLYLYYKQHQWLGPEGDIKNMLGLVVSREEFEYKLTKAAQSGLLQKITDDELEQIEMSEAAVNERISQTECVIQLLELFKRFELDEFERACVILAYAVEMDSKYERLLSYLQDDITKKLPTIPLAVQLYLPRGSTVEEYISFFDRETSFTALFEREELFNNNLRLRPVVTEFLSSGAVSPTKGMYIFDGALQKPDDPLIIRPELAEKLDAITDSGHMSIISLIGPEGSGRSFQLRHLCTRRGEKCLFVDMAALGYAENSISEAALIARLTGASLCFDGLEKRNDEGELETPAPALMEAISRVRIEGELFLLTQKPLRYPMERAVLELTLEPAELSERLALFTHYFSDLKPETGFAELASKFRFEPSQVKRAAVQAAGLIKIGETLDSAAVHKCCYGQVVHKLDRLAFRVKPLYTWDDVVLPETQKALMRHACAHIQYQHRVYTDWGFDKKISYGKGLSILFAGVPGTGKTMCAQVLAGQLNMEMYKINISQIVSKYIGETEKNLNAVFKEAKNSNCILFFDECDALFGKRSEVKDAHDRNANVEVAYLLQQIEEHDGVCVLASNLVQNIDAAFMRRITYVVHFPFPNAQARKEIYLRTIPGAAPLDEDIDWEFIAEKFSLSGGHIKNIVLSAAFMAAADDAPIGMSHLLTAAVNELKKNEIVVVREELREYADLIR